MTTLRIILGPTASGKERLALACAERMNGEIVSVDSMKVYRGLDVATAKAGPEEAFSAADFVRAAEAAIADIASRGKTPFLSGGTAFYYKALLEGLFDGPGADRAFRARLEERAAREGSAALHAELMEKDAAAAGKIHPSDCRRIVRALEVVTLTGQGISASQTQWV
ncbi:MAG: tRNA (adenosine(37)-N6)-dimethylallyltransferase MiaA, partial [Planctomycetota bacterium]|nr:tRNA (adenosine(37)-N6)-dimethylallyltransferase MiaA [Planctomycetota bacterium]